MSSKSHYLVRILSQNLDVEIYHFNQNHLSLQQKSTSLKDLKGKKIDKLILSFSLDLIARGSRKVSKIKRIDNVFYFEKHLLGSKTEIYFHPAQVVKEELIQFWMKSALWNAIQKELEVLTYQKIISTIDSVILHSAKIIPNNMGNRLSVWSYDVQGPYHFFRTQTHQKRDNFQDLNIEINKLIQTPINFHKLKKQKIIKPQHWLVFFLILNGLAFYLYWFTPKPLLNLNNKTNVVNDKLITLGSMLNQNQRPLVLELDKILSLVIDDYNEKIINLFLEKKNFTIIFQELSDQDLNKISKRFDEHGWRIENILNANDQVIMEGSLP